MQVAQRKEQQRQQQLAEATRGTREQRPSGCWLTRGYRRLQIAEQTRLMGGWKSITALRLPPQRWFARLPDFFPAWLAALLHPCVARTALR